MYLSISFMIFAQPHILSLHEFTGSRQDTNTKRRYDLIVFGTIERVHPPIFRRNGVETTALVVHFSELSQKDWTFIDCMISISKFERRMKWLQPAPVAKQLRAREIALFARVYPRRRAVSVYIQRESRDGNSNAMCSA